MADVRIGTVDLPERVERERYFEKLNYLELSALFTAPLKQVALAGWAALAPPGAIGLAAPFVLTHRTPPKSNKLWPHDARGGDFRDSPQARAALEGLAAAVSAVQASSVLFKSPPLFAPSAANRDQLRAFFGEIATAESVGAADRVWVPDGLWEPRVAAAFATELGVTVALDPLVVEPGQPPELYEELEVAAIYFRVSGLGRPSPLGMERLDDLVALIESYADVPLTIAFDSPARWADAKNLAKLVSVGAE